ncbi:hypothetical protein BIZ37_03525 [Photobacterium sp. BZF1]|uniref:hypothetical protein n=1 Tax=Photobacterium sp. BZF1 TaxID=1904457 RepID=UPI00165382A5|nr:hypothetical protein [Photobacterium sp. BZF1]MBC7001619.1 hypothetical protein [Photobacterium sp. BZF1]
MKPTPKQLNQLADKLETAIAARHFAHIAKLNTMLATILPEIEQSEPAYLKVVNRLKLLHQSCVDLVDSEQSKLKLQLVNNVSLRERDKAYATTKARAGD